MKQQAATVDADLYATLETLNETGIRKFAHALIDALSGSPSEQTLRLFLAGQKKSVKVLALQTHAARMRENNPK